MKQRILMFVVAMMLMIGSALPALAQPSDGPPCNWDWDRYMWRVYEYELWYFGCDEEDGWNIYAFWNPDYGYWFP